MLLTFKTSVAYKKNLTSRRTTVRCEADFVGHNFIFLSDIVQCPVLIFRPVFIILRVATVTESHGEKGLFLTGQGISRNSVKSQGRIPKRQGNFLNS